MTAFIWQKLGGPWPDVHKLLKNFPIYKNSCCRQTGNALPFCDDSLDTMLATHCRCSHNAIVQPAVAKCNATITMRLAGGWRSSPQLRGDAPSTAPLLCFRQEPVQRHHKSESSTKCQFVPTALQTKGGVPPSRGYSPNTVSKCCGGVLAQMRKGSEAALVLKKVAMACRQRTHPSQAPSCQTRCT